MLAQATKLLLFTPALLLAILFDSQPATAGHSDGNIYSHVNYRPVQTNVVYVCDNSTETTIGNMSGALQAWDSNAQFNVADASCSGAGINVVDVPDGWCSPTANACADYPSNDAPQTLVVHMEEDSDGVVEDAYQWDVDYFPNDNLAGAPSSQTLENKIDHDWGSGAPSGLPSNGFSARWDANLYFKYSGVYEFTTNTDDGVRLYVNGALVINAWDLGPGVRTTTVNFAQANTYEVRMEYREIVGLAYAKLEIGHTTAAGSTLTHELGHTLGFKHHPQAGCQWNNALPSIMGDNHCTNSTPPHPIAGAAGDRQNWDLAYWADPSAFVSASPPNSTPGCASLLWGSSVVHNEKSFDLWSVDPGWNFVTTFPQNQGAGAFCGQMPGTRPYYLFSVTKGHLSYFGGNQSISLNIPGALPQITSLVAYGPETMVVSWNNSNPGGADVHIEMSTNGSSWTEVGTDTASPFTHGGRAAGTRYWYRLRSHSHTGGGFSSYSNVVDAYTPPNVPGTHTGNFNYGGNVNRVGACWSATAASSYKLFFYKAGASSGYTVTVSPNTSCYGAVLRAETLTPEVYHIAVSACVAGSVCSPYRDMSGAYWWWIPCNTSGGCSAGGSPDPGGHNH